MSLARITAAACFLLVTLSAYACSSDKATTEPLPTPMSEIGTMDLCGNQARDATTARFGEDALAWTSELTAFTYRLWRVGDQYGVTVAATSSDNFSNLYQELLGQPLWAQQQAYNEASYDQCLAEHGIGGLGSDELSSLPGDWPRTECVTRALVQTEQEYGAGSVDYSPEFISFAQSASIWSGFSQLQEDYRQSTGVFPFEGFFLAEGSYEAMTGQSPFRDSAAMQAFREKASPCLEATP